MKSQPPPPCKIKAGRAVRAEDKIRIELTIQNPGDRPVFAVNRVRRLEFDATTNKLTLWFSDHGRKSEQKKNVRQEFSVPKTSPIDAGGETTLIETLPDQMTRLVPHDDGTFELEALDLKQVNQVEIHVAVDDKPFYLNPSQKDFLQQLTRWGADVSTTVRLTTPRYDQTDKEVE